ncbi:hypothetical protein BH11ACT5_BH11ACT5_21880 [soil metagenome]
MTSPALIETDPLVVAIVSVSLTLAVGVVVGVVTAWLTRRGEHAKWVRERRYDAYVAFMVDMAAFTDLLNRPPKREDAQYVADRLRSLSEKFMESFESVSLLGPKRVNAKGQLWVGSAIARGKGEVGDQETSAARWQFLIVAGRVLKSKNVGKQPPPRFESPTSPSGDVTVVPPAITD